MSNSETVACSGAFKHGNETDLLTFVARHAVNFLLHCRNNLRHSLAPHLLRVLKNKGMVNANSDNEPGTLSKRENFKY